MNSAKPSSLHVQAQRRVADSLRAVCVAAVLAGSASHALADKAVTLVTAFPAGGGADAVARLVAPKLAASLGQTVVVDNKPGASGNLAAEMVARAPGDGGTLLMHNNTLTINATIGMRQGFDLRSDLAPLAVVASTPIVIAVNPSLPVKTLAELIRYAKQHPDTLSFASCGNGTAQHFAGVQFNQRAGVNLVHIPYKGCAPAVIDGVGGAVQVLFNTIPNLDPQVQAGKLRYLAVASAKRVAIRPELPTVGETPGLEGFSAEVWFGFFAPARTPMPQRESIEKALLAAMDDPALQAQFDARLITRRVLDSKALSRQIDDDLATWKRLAVQFNVVPD